MAFSIVFIVAAVVIGLVSLMILAISGFVLFNVFRSFSRTMKNAETQDGNAGRDKLGVKRRALEAINQQPQGSPGYKCGSCGATVDSTAELSPDGRIRCNYCNAWSSIY